MGEIVNLRRARKARDRREAEALARANRAAHGRAKSERETTQAQKRLDALRLDAHKRDGQSEP